jgi:hypothetical protein
MNQVINGIITDYDGTYLTIKAKYDNRLGELLMFQLKI